MFNIKKKEMLLVILALLLSIWIATLTLTLSGHQDTAGFVKNYAADTFMD